MSAAAVGNRDDAAVDDHRRALPAAIEIALLSATMINSSAGDIMVSSVAGSTRLRESVSRPRRTTL